MGYHEYKGNKQHTFRRYNENCSWCGKYIISGHRISFNSEKYGVHRIETDYCSPKCLSDDNRFSGDYFEKRVLMFLELGGEKEYIELQKQKKIEYENWKIEQSIKEKQEEEKERRELTIKILMSVIGCGTAVIVMYNLLNK